MIEERCEAQNSIRPGYICPVCSQCFCWRHLQHSDCKACHKLLAKRSFEHNLVVRSVSFLGGGPLLCLFLFSVHILLDPCDPAQSSNDSRQTGTSCARIQASFRTTNNKDRDAAMMKPFHLSLICLIGVLAYSTGVFAPHAARIEE